MKIEELHYFNNRDTPFYHYDLSLLKATLREARKGAQKHNYIVHYALKANNNLRLLNIIRNHGFGIDCVSGGEIELALSSGFPPSKIVFAGVGKTDEEIKLALSKNIFCFNVESIEELTVIDSMACEMNVNPFIALRLNPNINAKTHHYITTGLKENKFGIFEHEIKEALQLITKSRRLNLIGLHFHIGSQITDMTVYKQLCFKVNHWNEWFYQKGFDLSILNLGGGLGIDYTHSGNAPIPDFQLFFNIFKKNLNLRPNQKIHFELGRSLVGSCGSLITKTLFIKKGKTTNFAIVDAGMTDFIRPALYQSYHKIEKITETTLSTNILAYEVVGPICESSDCFGKNILLPELKRGDLLRICSTGAYGEVMASQYNMRKTFPCNYQV